METKFLSATLMFSDLEQLKTNTAARSKANLLKTVLVFFCAIFQLSIVSQDSEKWPALLQFKNVIKASWLNQLRRVSRFLTIKLPTLFPCSTPCSMAIM